MRLASDEDIPALETLIPISVRALQLDDYSSEQMEAALGSVFGVDRQLIHDGTYFVVERGGEIIGCGGWSKHKKLFGSDAIGTAENVTLNPDCDPARIRAFFVHPDWARRGVGRAILEACEKSIRSARFHSAELVATLAGEPFYAAFGYAVMERYEILLSNGLPLPVVRMRKDFTPN